MGLLPEYVGAAAFGIKLGVITPGCDLCAMITAAFSRAAADGLLDTGDVVCVTESVVARAQGNFVSKEEVSAEIHRVLGVDETARIGVVFPILSRNRFSMILKGIAAAVPRGEVVVVLSYPTDEVGNELLPREFVDSLDIPESGMITTDDLGGRTFLHPITKVDYLKLYREMIESEGAKATLVMSNDPAAAARFSLDGVIAADIHTRGATEAALRRVVTNCISLVDLCSEGERSSEWGLLGSNMSAGNRLKLAPKDARGFAETVREALGKETGADVEVIVNGDGAYKDPSTGIYELADPMPVFGATSGVYGRLREGIKYKFIADTAFAEGKSPEEIELDIDKLKKTRRAQGHQENEGTTPRRLEDIIASLADLVSGSADAGTPVVLVKGFLKA